MACACKSRDLLQVSNFLNTIVPGFSHVYVAGAIDGYAYGEIERTTIGPVSVYYSQQTAGGCKAQQAMVFSGSETMILPSAP